MAANGPRVHGLPRAERASFWTGWGAAVLVIGGTLMGVGVAQTTSQKPSVDVWSNGWFKGGFIALVIGAGILVWALILFLTNGRAFRWLAEHVRFRSPVFFRQTNPAIPAAQVPRDGDSGVSIPADWQATDAERIHRYELHRGLFLVHTSTPSTEPGQKADVILRLAQHGDGPLTWGKISSVEYVLGHNFDDHV
jgi:hypothetical protein